MTIAALFLGATLGVLLMALFNRVSYRKGWGDGFLYAKDRTQGAIDRLAAAHRDNIAQVIGTMAPLPPSEEVREWEESQ